MSREEILVTLRLIDFPFKYNLIAHFRVVLLHSLVWAMRAKHHYKSFDFSLV